MIAIVRDRVASIQILWEQKKFFRFGHACRLAPSFVKYEMPETDSCKIVKVLVRQLGSLGKGCHNIDHKGDFASPHMSAQRHRLDI